MKREAWTFFHKQSDACEMPTTKVQTCYKRYTGIITGGMYARWLLSSLQGMFCKSGQVILVEEISHCKAGVEWFRYVSKQFLERDSLADSSVGRSDQEEDMIAKEFHSYVRKYFHGKLKRPFNEEARAKAGFSPDWYIPLAE